MDFLPQVQDPSNLLVMDNNLGWGPQPVLGQTFLEPDPSPGLIDKRSWTSGFSGAGCKARKIYLESLMKVDTVCFAKEEWARGGQV